MVFGDVQLNHSSVSHVEADIERVYVHPMYNRISSWNDLAVLKLASPVVFTDAVRPICLQADLNEANYSTCYTGGWGIQSITTNGIKFFITHLKFLTL